MEAIRDPQLMQRVDFTAEVFAPLARRALFCRKQHKCDRARHICKKAALKLCSQVPHPNGRTLATLACLGYSPKAIMRTCPDMWVLVEEMEAVVEEMLKVAPLNVVTGHGTIELTDAELRGVHALTHRRAAEGHHHSHHTNHATTLWWLPRYCYYFYCYSHYYSCYDYYYYYYYY